MQMMLTWVRSNQSSETPNKNSTRAIEKCLGLGFGDDYEERIVIGVQYIIVEIVIPSMASLYYVSVQF